MAILNKRPPESLEGIYEVVEAAKYIYVGNFLDNDFKPNPTMLLRWIRQGFSSPDLVNVPSRQLLIDFEDLVSLRAITFLLSLGVSWQKIRDADSYLRKQTGHSRPFATQRLWTEAVDIFAEIDGFILAASKGGQLPFLELVRNNLVDVHGLTFSKKGIADSWTPREVVILRPNIQSGNPCIKGTGIPTRSIWNMYQGGDSVGFIGESYGVAENDIIQALKWESDLNRVTFIRAPKAA